MAIVINGTGTISGISATDGLSSPQTGSVLQVVQGSLGGQISTSSSTFISSGLSASITPKFSSSKILALVFVNQAYNSSGGTSVFITLYRGSTNLQPTGSGTNANFGQVYANSSALLCNNTFTFLDSPATTSSTTYTVYWATGGGAGYLNQNGCTSYIQLMEIAG